MNRFVKRSIKARGKILGKAAVFLRIDDKLRRSDFGRSRGTGRRLNRSRFNDWFRLGRLLKRRLGRRRRLRDRRGRGRGLFRRSGLRQRQFRSRGGVLGRFRRRLRGRRGVTDVASESATVPFFFVVSEREVVSDGLDGESRLFLRRVRFDPLRRVKDEGARLSNGEGRARGIDLDGLFFFFRFRGDVESSLPVVSEIDVRLRIRDLDLAFERGSQRILRTPFRSRLRLRRTGFVL